METPNSPIDKLKQIFQDDTLEEEKKSIEELFEEISDKKVDYVDELDCYKMRSEDTFGQINKINMEAKVVKVKIEALKHNQEQGRLGYEDGFFSEKAQELMRSASIQRLATSIKTNGLLQHIVIMPNDEMGSEYTVIFGYQRVLAHILLGQQKLEPLLAHF